MYKTKYFNNTMKVRWTSTLGKYDLHELKYSLSYLKAVYSYDCLAVAHNF